MDPTQQPQQPQPGATPPQPSPPPTNGGFYGAPSQQPQQTPPAPSTSPSYTPQQPAAPVAPPPSPQPGFGPQPAPTYAVDYLDQIAPPPAKPGFLSGGFGKAVIALMAVFILAVSIIVAFGNQKKTADLEAIALRLDTLQPVAKNTHKNLKNGKLIAINSNYQIWLVNVNKDAYDLLAQAEVKKTDMDKKVKAAESAKKTELTEKFNDARLNANLDRVYSREMAYQADLLLTMYTQMSKQSEAKAIRDYAKTAISNLTPIQKSFAEFDDSV